MARGKDPQKVLFARLSSLIDLQTVSHEKLMQSQAMSDHAAAVRETSAVIQTAITQGSFETLLNTELAIQMAEREKFSRVPKMMESIRKTQEDMSAGLQDYRQLQQNPKSYLDRGYRERDRTGPNKEFPVDTMRKALRSQATRVGNFAKNPMLSMEEKEFHLLRVAMLKQAEKLYEKLQMKGLDTQRSDPPAPEGPGTV